MLRGYQPGIVLVYVPPTPTTLPAWTLHGAAAQDDPFIAFGPNARRVAGVFDLPRRLEMTTRCANRPQCRPEPFGRQR